LISTMHSHESIMNFWHFIETRWKT
jgi:hypothetical protein